MKKKRILTVIIALLVAVAAVCGILYYKAYHTAKDEIAEYTLIQDEYSKVAGGTDPAPLMPLDPDSPGYTEVDFSALRDINPEVVGWISIPRSQVNYPVMQATDNSKYLNTSFFGKRSSTGAVFVDAKNNVRELDQNVVIYAHNMGSHRTDMFGELLNYNDQSYYESHRYIQFDTYWEKHGWWEVIAVIRHDTRSSRFNYLKLEFESQDEFMEWVAAAQDLSLYDTGVHVGENDKIITLSTCDRTYYGKYGRQLILAVKVNK